jgi:hypothetical protein
MRTGVDFAEDIVTAGDIPDLNQTGYHSVTTRAQEQVNGTLKHQHGSSSAVNVKKTTSQDRGKS